MSKKKQFPQAKPGTYQPLANLRETQIPGASHEISHDPNFMAGLVETAAPMLAGISVEKLNGMFQYADLEDDARAMMNLLAAKKMAYAVDGDVSTEFSDVFKYHRNVTYKAPEPFIKAIEGLGRFKLGQTAFAVQSPEIHAFSHFAKAVMVLGQDQIPAAVLPTDIIVNRATRGWVRSALEYYRGIYNRWAASSEQFININVGGQNLTIAPPRLVGGFQHIAGILANAGANVPQDVLNAIGCAALLNAGMGVPNWVPNPVQLNGLAQNGLIVVNWNHETVDRLYLQFLRIRHARLIRTCSFMWNVPEVRTMGDWGEPWQLVSNSGGIAELPFSVEAQHVETGYMMGQQNRVRFRQAHLQISGPETRTEVRQKFLEAFQAIREYPGHAR